MKQGWITEKKYLGVWAMPGQPQYMGFLNAVVKAKKVKALTAFTKALTKQGYLVGRHDALDYYHGVDAIVMHAKTKEFITIDLSERVKESYKADLLIRANSQDSDEELEKAANLIVKRFNEYSRLPTM